MIGTAVDTIEPTEPTPGRDTCGRRASLTLEQP
jgi:hypothetical protein